MTLSGAIPGHGIELRQSESGGTGTYTLLIGEVHDIKGPALKQNTADSTHHESGGWDEEIATTLAVGDVTFEVGFITTGSHGASAGLAKWLTDKTAEYFLLIFPDSAGTHWYFRGLVVGFAPSAPVKGLLSADVTLRGIGQPTLA